MTPRETGLCAPEARARRGAAAGTAALLRGPPGARAPGRVKRAALGMVCILLAACTAPQGNDTFARWTPPVVTWRRTNPISLPMDTISMDGRVMFYVVELTMNGSRGLFLVDSGSSSTLFTREFASGLNLKVSAGRNSVVFGIGWSRKATTVVLDSIDLGFARIQGLEIPSDSILGVLFERPVISNDGRPISGIVGMDLLVPLGASLDLNGSKITFQKAQGQSTDLMPALSLSPAGNPPWPRLGSNH
jgi:hypothetical protein